MIELIKTNLKDTDYRVLYVCDGRKCEHCDRDMCTHTLDISHAVSFTQEYPGIYVQRIVPLSAPIDMTDVMIEDEEGQHATQ